MPRRRVHVVINPAAGQDEPILNTLNRVFKEAEIDWDISLTKQAGDARQQAQTAAQSGVDIVAVYGGDGTVAEVASGLLGTSIPLAILPGGTANVLSVELGIPATLALACQLICDPKATIRKMDMGQVNDHYFMLRVGIGFEAAMVENADRGLKDKYGVFAYLWSAMQNLYKPEVARYQLTIDGKQIETEGVNCMIANSGNMGQAGLNFLPSINVSDGLLDIIVVQEASLRTFFDVIGSIAGLKQVESDQLLQASLPDKANNSGQPATQSLQYWQGREVSLVTDPPQTIQFDGEILGKVAIHCKIIPQAISILVPTVQTVAAG